MVDFKLFNPFSIDEQALMLAYHIPIGRAWSRSFDPSSNLGKLIRGLGVEFYRLQVLTQKISSEINLNVANELLIEWEKSVGIPDECFSTNVTIEERRNQALLKLGNFGGVQKSSDFVSVASIFGFDVRVLTGSIRGTFPIEFPLIFFDSTKSARHTIIIEILNAVESDTFFPLPFPIPFSSGGTTFLQCIFDVLAPANVNIIIKTEDEI